MKFGGYEVTGPIGRGGMGAVYRARSPRGEDVAVKLLLRGNAENLARFERERRLLEEFTAEDGFVPLLDAGSEKGQTWLVMPFVPGGTLRARLDRGPLGAEATADLGRRLAAALGKAHEKGIVHRDLKPENVLFDAAGRPLVADLGLGKHFDGGSPGASQSVALTRAGEMRGTVGYMPPEQARDASSVGPEGDVFSLGAILHECLAGEPAFFGHSPLEVLGRVDNGTREPLARLAPDAPRWLVRAIDRALARTPRDRFADGRAFAAALSPTGGSPRRWPIVAALAALLVAGSLGAWSLVRGAAPSPPPSPGAPAVVAPERRVLAGPLVIGREGEFVARVDSSVFVYVPEARFQFGADPADPEAEDKEKPRRPVMLSPFYAGKYKVTTAQFRRFVEVNGYRTKAERALPPMKGDDHWWWDGPRVLTVAMTADGADYVAEPTASWRFPYGAKDDPARDDDPVLQVAWEDAVAYAEWVGATLLTEAQWEAAACWDPKTGVTHRYPWGDSVPTLTRARFLDVLSHERLGPAAERSNVSFVGCVQMAGNAREWVLDTETANHAWLSREQAALDPVMRGKPTDHHMTKGGSARELPGHCRSSFRAPAVGSDDRTTFRLALPAR